VYSERDVEFGIIVSTQFRRRGIGSALVRGLLEQTRGSGLSLLASCDSSNAPALRLLRTFGFRPHAQGAGTLWLVRPCERELRQLQRRASHADQKRLEKNCVGGSKPASPRSAATAASECGGSAP